MKDDSKKLIFSEDFDYSQTGDSSIWGDGDAETLDLLKKLVAEKKIFGKWLNFAAGDGRYNSILLSEADSVLATDIDLGALDKLKKNTPNNLLEKLVLQEQNIVEDFQFENNEFDGVFNTGTLHLFPKYVLSNIFSEVYRILKEDGLFIFDFATDVKRVADDGRLIGRSEYEYSHRDAKSFLSTELKENGFAYELYEGIVEPEEVTSADGTYLFSCKYWLVVANKKVNK